MADKHRRDARRHRRADRRRRSSSTTSPVEHVRRRLHRLAGDEHDSRHGARDGAARRTSSSPTARRCRCRRARAPTTASRCCTASAPSIARVGDGAGLPVRRRRRRADRRRHAALLPLRRPGRHGDRPRSRVGACRASAITLAPDLAARPSVRRGERGGGSPRDASTFVDKLITRGGDTMSDSKRRDFLKSHGRRGGRQRAGRQRCSRRASSDAQQWTKLTPEKGAQLRVLRWKRFVQGDEDVWAANTKKFTADDRHRRCASTPRAGRTCGRRRRSRRTSAAGPTSSSARWRTRTCIRRSSSTSPTSRTISATSTAAGTPVGKAYGMRRQEVGRDHDGRAGNAIVYRDSQVKAAGFDSVPKDMDGFLQAVPGAEGQGDAARLRARQRDRRLELDALARVGARRQARRREEQRRHQQPGDDRARSSTSKQLYDTFVPGTLSWLDPNNNKAFLDGQISLTRNGISVYYAAKNVDRTRSCRRWRRTSSTRTSRSASTASRRELNLVLPDDDLQVHEVPERREGVPALHDGERSSTCRGRRRRSATCAIRSTAYETSAFWTADPKNDAVPRLR